MVDLVHQLREDAKTAHPDSLRIMCGWGADEIVRLRASVKSIDAAIDAYAKSLGKSRESLVIQNHEPSWRAWKKLCDTLSEK